MNEAKIQKVYLKSDLSHSGKKFPKLSKLLHKNVPSSSIGYCIFIQSDNIKHEDLFS